MQVEGQKAILREKLYHIDAAILQKQNELTGIADFLVEQHELCEILRGCRTLLIILSTDPVSSLEFPAEMHEINCVCSAIASLTKESYYVETRLQGHPAHMTLSLCHRKWKGKLPPAPLPQCPYNLTDAREVAIKKVKELQSDAKRSIADGWLATKHVTNTELVNLRNVKASLENEIKHLISLQQ
jgi:hypothetical protein